MSGQEAAPRRADTLAAARSDHVGWLITEVKLAGGTWYRATRPGRNILVRDLPTLRVMLEQDPAADQPGGAS